MIYGLDKVFSSSGQSSMNAALNAATQSIKDNINNKQTNVDIERFEQVLNNLFYGNNPPSQAQEYQQKMAKETEQEIVDRINSIALSYQSEAGGSVSSITKKSIHKNTMQQAINKAKANLERIGQMTSQVENEAGINQALNIMNQAIVEAESVYNLVSWDYLQEVSHESGYGSFASDEGARLKLAYAKLLDLNKATNGGKALTQKQAGDAFEEVFQQLGPQAVKDMVDGTVKDLTSELTGKNSIQRGIAGPFEYTLQLKKGKGPEIKDTPKRFKVSNGEDMIITYSYNPGAARQGKMDVQITYKDGSGFNDIRASLKNWRSQKTDSLGETDIEGAIARTVGNNLTECYRAALLQSRDQFKNNKIVKFICAESAHSMARLAIAADIAMGLKQKTHWANILIVDTGSAIKVKSLANILKDWDSSASTNIASLTGYNVGNIEKGLSNAYKNIYGVRSPGRSSAYHMFASSVLSGIKVSFRLSRSADGI